MKRATPIGGARHVQHAALEQVQVLRGARLAAGEAPPGLVERRVGRGIGRHVPDRLPGQLLQPEIGARRKLDHLHVLLDQRDEGHEQRAVETIPVKLAGRHVRGRHHHHAELEQPREQPAEDHGIGDVGDVELVEAEQPALLRDVGRGEPDRILVGGGAVPSAAGG